MKKIESFLGKQVKKCSNKVSTWEIDPESIQKINSDMMKQVHHIKVFESQFDEELVASVVLKNSTYVNFKLDKKFKGEAGDMIDPRTFKVFNRVNKELDKTIQRAYGKVLEDIL